MSRPQKKYHYIYKTTCLITGKFYVGMHSTDNLEDGYLGSGKILGYSRRKYGDENHTREILEMLPSREALKLREKEIVNEELLSHPLNINLKYGGDGGWEHVDYSPFRDVVVQKEMCRRAAENTKERWKIPEYRAEMLLVLKRARKNSKGFLGKQHSADTLAKMRIALQGKQDGEKNSQFGTCWVTNGTPIKIKKEQLDEYLANGYSRGRKFNVPVE